MPRPCCPCKRSREVTRQGDQLLLCACPCDHTAPTGEKTIKRAAAGLCTRCGAREPEPGYRCCSGCRAGQRKWTATRVAEDQRLERIAREAVGIAKAVAP